MMDENTTPRVEKSVKNPNVSVRNNGVKAETGESKTNQKTRLKVNPDFLQPGDVVIVPQTLF